MPTPHFKPTRSAAWPLMLLAATFCTTLTVTAQPARAELYWESYVPPEIAYADDLHQRVTLPKGKRNINQLNLNQLQTLPGFDQELALKVIRLRPMADFRDFYRMPGIDRKQADRLIRQLQPKVLFK